MEEQKTTGKGTRRLEPGSIDKTRRNIGPIDAREAEFMQKKLGGEVLQERSLPIEEINIPGKKRRPEVIRASGLSSSDISSRSASVTAISNTKQMGSVNQLISSSNQTKRRKTDEDLPAITARDEKLMDHLMMSHEYSIKPNYGIFNVFFRMSTKNRERVSRSFGEYLTKRHVDHMQTFVSTIKTFIQLSPDIYKSKIAQEPDLKFKFLRTIGHWTMRDIKVLAIDVQNMSENLTVAMLIPFVRAVYHELITIYYIGEQQIPALIKEIYSDLTAFADSDQKKLQMLAKQGITEWIYIYNQIIKGMYPLLMRMCSSEYVEFPRFFTSQIAQILQFLNVGKFDLLLPEKKKKSAEDAKKREEERRKKAEESVHIAGKRDELVNTGLKILEQLFPQAGFSSLESHPDLYPYFQPIYKFRDGFNVVHPENPVQVTVILIRIIEDLFQGCRNINFNTKADQKLSSMGDDIVEAMNDWASYHEDLFDKKYGDYLSNYVNRIYTQKDYVSSQAGKENLNNILWRAKYYYLPHFKFNAPLIQKPVNDTKYKPLYSRTDFLKTVLSIMAGRIDEASAGKKAVLGVMNPWDRYQFDLPNSVSKRLDVLLGAKRSDAETAATNANLIKYTLCLISVLDWWINNPASPAYSTDPENLYRISEKDGGPQFSVEERSDQNQLFTDAIKKAIAARQNA